MKQNLQVNVSGGRTSAYMAWWLKKHMSEQYNMLFIFANTGAEHPDTYRFLRCVDEEFKLNLVKVECVIDPRKGHGTRHKVVEWDTMAKNGEPFEAEIAKHGISNVVYKHCTRELKMHPINNYTKECFSREYKVAIGIRPDEQRRVKSTGAKYNYVYPLVEWHPQGYEAPDKQFILDWFKQFSWDLKIPEHLGNCKTCYKKSDRKLALVYEDNPAHFDFFLRMEEEYGHVKPDSDQTPGPRRWWRGYRTTQQMIEQFKAGQRYNLFNDVEDDHGCSDSCEPYEMENQ